jgi:hypothetical protein
LIVKEHNPIIRTPILHMRVMSYDEMDLTKALTS